MKTAVLIFVWVVSTILTYWGGTSFLKRSMQLNTPIEIFVLVVSMFVAIYPTRWMLDLL